MTIALLLAIFIVCVALLRSEGLWSNVLLWVNVLFGALLATNYFEPLADWLKGQDNSYDYFWDFIALWGLFVVCVGLMRLATDRLSRTRVRFSRPVDLIGGLLFAAWTGLLLVCFTTMSLHTAPLAQVPLGGSFQPTPQASNFPLDPDRRWLSFMQAQSDGALARPAPASNPHAHQFDPRGDFILRYGTSRANFERSAESTVRGGRAVKQ